MKWTILALICLQCANITAQDSNSGLSSHDKYVAVTDILGIWSPLDTLQNHIEFVNVESVHVEMRGIKHGVNYYIFQMTGDSIQTRGMAINWPPYDCELRLVDPTTLDIHFFQYNDSTGIIMRYVR